MRIFEVLLPKELKKRKNQTQVWSTKDVIIKSHIQRQRTKHDEKCSCHGNKAVRTISEAWQQGRAV